MILKLAAAAMLSAAVLLPGCYEQQARVETTGLPELAEEDYDHLVEIRGHAFLPGTLSVEKGENVLWVNLDGVRHTVTSVGEKILDSPFLAGGETYSAVFEEAGEYEYMCRPHPRMRGKVIVRE